MNQICFLKIFSKKKIIAKYFLKNKKKWTKRKSLLYFFLEFAEQKIAPGCQCPVSSTTHAAYGAVATRNNATTSRAQQSKFFIWAALNIFKWFSIWSEFVGWDGFAWFCASRQKCAVLFMLPFSAFQFYLHFFAYLFSCAEFVVLRVESDWKVSEVDGNFRFFICLAGWKYFFSGRISIFKWFRIFSQSANQIHFYDDCAGISAIHLITIWLADFSQTDAGS